MFYELDNRTRPVRNFYKKPAFRGLFSLPLSPLYLNLKLFKMYYVYILESLVDGTFYKGSSENYERRLEQHNNGESQYTSRKRPWKIVFAQEMSTKREALIREKAIKRYNSEYLNRLIDQPFNLVKFPKPDSQKQSPAEPL